MSAKPHANNEDRFRGASMACKVKSQGGKEIVHYGNAPMLFFECDEKSMCRRIRLTPMANEVRLHEAILEDISNKNSRPSRGPKEPTQAKSRSRLGPGVATEPVGGGDHPEVEALRCREPVGPSTAGVDIPEVEALRCSEPVGSSSGGSHVPEVEALRCCDPAGASGGGNSPGKVVPLRRSHRGSTVHSVKHAGGIGLVRAGLPHDGEGDYPAVEVLRGSTRGPTTRSTRNRYIHHCKAITL